MRAAREGVRPVKQLVAIVKPFRAEAVLNALAEMQIEALTVSEAKGFGRQKSYLDRYGESEYSLAFLPKVRVCCWVPDAQADEAIRRIVAASRTGRIGDGKVLVLPLLWDDAIDV